MPLVGLGTFQAHSEDVQRAVSDALDVGYLRIDTASIYRNEKFIGQALAARGIKREDVFITSKIPPAALSFEATTQSCLTSLSDLQVDYVDLMLIHWPAKSGLKKDSPKHAESRKEAWQALEALYDQGKCRAIGVSNYTVDHLTQMQTYWRIKPAVNQVECHPLLQQTHLREWCKTNDIFVEAYSSLGAGKLLTHEVVLDIAKECNKDPAQVLLRWGLQQNLAVIPKSIKKERIETNFQLFDFNISETHMQRLNALESNHHYCWDPTDVR